MRTLKVEEVYLAGYETFADVMARLPRMHLALAYMSPNQFEAEYALQAT